MGPSDFFHVSAAPRHYRNSGPYLAAHGECPRLRRLNRPKSSLEQRSKPFGEQQSSCVEKRVSRTQPKQHVLQFLSLPTPLPRGCPNGFQRFGGFARNTAPNQP